MFRAGMRKRILSKADFKPYLRRSCIDDTFFLSEHRIEKIRNENSKKTQNQECFGEYYCKGIYDSIEDVLIFFRKSRYH